MRHSRVPSTEHGRGAAYGCAKHHATQCLCLCRGFDRDVELGERGGGNKGDGYGFTLRGQAENWVYLPGTVGVQANSSLYIGLAQQVFGLTGEATRTQPYICPEDDIEEEAVYEIRISSTAPNSGASTASC